MRILLYILLLSFLLVFSNCVSLFLYWIKPSENFQYDRLPAAPDYSKTEYWAAHPNIKDEADEVPTGTDFKNAQDQAKADVFFVHPTTYIKADKWNADSKSSLIVYGLSPLKLQTSVFNESTRIYAPRYRQAALYSFIDDSGNGDKAFEIAKKDVLTAFEYYLNHYNNGRPFFIAGHSQGSMMLISVIKEHLDKKKNSNFVAAYLPGWAIKTNEFKNIKICQDEKSTGCIISWNSKKWGSTLEDFPLAPERYTDGICVNPVNWIQNSSEISREKHKGGIGVSFSTLDKQYVKTKCVGEMLWVDLPSNPEYESRRGNKKNYHIADYSLFYLDIRENIKLRLNTFLKNR